MRTSAAKKAAERDKLKAVRTVTVTLTIEANEDSFQRLAALMLLQDPTKEPFPEPAELAKMPWEAQPPPADAPPLELDYNAIRNDCIKWLPKHVEKHGSDVTKALILGHGGDNLKGVPEDNLLALLADLEAGCE